MFSSASHFVCHTLLLFHLTDLSTLCAFRSILHSRSRLIWILCQQGQDPSLQGHHGASVERSQSQRHLFFFSYVFNCAVFIFIVLLVYIRVTAQEFEIELEGSQYLRILCYEKCYDKSMLNKDDNEIVDKIMGKGQVQVGDRL